MPSDLQTVEFLNSPADRQNLIVAIDRSVVEMDSLSEIDLPLAAIRMDGGTQMRAQLDGATVIEYADLMRDAGGYGPFPPIVCYYDGSTYWLADGFHRVAAARHTNGRVPTIPAIVHPGDRRAAILHAAAANAAHGLRRTNADKHRAVETLLRDDEWRAWSDAEIARRCAVDPKTVGNLRRTLEINREIPDTSIRKRRDSSGRDTPVNVANVGAKPAPAPEPSAEIIVTTEETAHRILIKLAADLSPEESQVMLQDLADLRVGWYDNLLRCYLSPDMDRNILAIAARRLLREQKPILVPTVNEMIASTELAYRALYFGAAPELPDEPVAGEPASVLPDDDPALPIRRLKLVRLRDLYHEVMESFDEFGDLTGHFIATLAIRRGMVDMLAVIESNLSPQEERSSEP